MIKIYYSHLPFWRAEVLRVSLFIKDIPFEDIRVSREEFVNLIKTGFLPNGKRSPFHQLPVIEVDNQIIGQTGAIARYCGKVSNLYADDMLKAAKIDQIIDAATDITNKVSPTIKEKNLEKKMEDRKVLVNKLLPRWFRYLEHLLSENESTWFVEKMTIADIAIWRLLGWLTSGIIDGIPTSIVDDFPKLKNIHHQVHTHPKVQEWMLQTYGKEI
ncbi:glutathione S-transferase family protein [Alphaproteobacteria bacterium]|jgi:prostaglandin-H2 D-isomerase / glutathione transferase|nr:glutathione S-transferase [Alphaproteobacteria bacterium]MDC3269854.1 glutathione S-transferase family protein [Alphaproteobacteria bacterium]